MVEYEAALTDVIDFDSVVYPDAGYCGSYVDRSFDGSYFVVSNPNLPYCMKVACHRLHE